MPLPMTVSLKLLDHLTEILTPCPLWGHLPVGYLVSLPPLNSGQNLRPLLVSCAITYPMSPPTHYPQRVIPATSCLSSMSTQKMNLCMPPLTHWTTQKTKPYSTSTRPLFTRPLISSPPPISGLDLRLTWFKIPTHLCLTWWDIQVHLLEVLDSHLPVVLLALKLLGHLHPLCLRLCLKTKITLRAMELILKFLKSSKKLHPLPWQILPEFRKNENCNNLLG